MKNDETQKLLAALSWKMKVLRKERNLTQEDLAELTGLSLSQIARIETAKTNSSIGLLHQIARGFGITLSELTQNLEKDFMK